MNEIKVTKEMGDYLFPILGAMKERDAYIIHIVDTSNISFEEMVEGQRVSHPFPEETFVQLRQYYLIEIGLSISLDADRFHISQRGIEFFMGLKAQIEADITVKKNREIEIHKKGERIQ